MKRFLLFIFIALPTFLWAQPALIFTPADGATNISTAATLIIDSDQALRRIDDSNLDDANVDALITLVDNTMTSIPFDAVIDGPRKKITITLYKRLLL